MNKDHGLAWIRCLLVVFAVLGCLLGIPAIGNAQSKQPAPTATVQPTQGPLRNSNPTPTAAPHIAATAVVKAPSPDLVTLALLNQGELTLQGPYDSVFVGFVLPATWQLRDAAKVNLDLSVFVTSQGTATTSGFGGQLLAEINDQVIGSINLDRIGERTVELAIPAAALTAQNVLDNRISLRLKLDAGFTCNFNQQTNVVVRTSSGLLLPHSIVNPPTDLALLPRPIFQRSFEPDSAVVVLPDAPSAAELQSALAVVAGLGQSTSKKLAVSLTTTKLLSEQQRTQSHLIYVGKSAAFPQLATVSFPATLGGASISATGMKADDGILQMAVSPWNAARVLLSVSGNSDAGIIKAGQAVSNSTVRSYVKPNLALVSEIKSLPAPKNVPIDRTFADLGYSVRTLTDRSSRQVEYQFYVPAGQVLDGDAYVKLSLSHSAMINLEQSGATISLNDQPIGSIQFSEATTSLASLQFGIPQSLIRPGNNILHVVADLNRYFGCSNVNNQNLWFSIWPESEVHIPLGPGGNATTQTFSLVGFPSLLTTDNELGDVAFVLAKNDPAGWGNAAQIAFVLGDRASGSFANLSVVYADAIPETIRNERSLIIVGRASQLPVLADLKEVLPATFEAGSDLANERGLPVEYRVAPGASVGYIQAIPSLWNTQRGILAVLGSDDAAVQKSTTTLLNPDNRSQLIGNFAVITDAQIIAARPESAVVVPNPAAAVTVQASVDQVVVSRPAWVFPAIVIMSLLLVAVVGVVIVGRARENRRNIASS